jgi:hypothetical protein
MQMRNMTKHVLLWYVLKFEVESCSVWIARHMPVFPLRSRDYRASCALLVEDELLKQNIS